MFNPFHDRMECRQIIPVPKDLVQRMIVCEARPCDDAMCESAGQEACGKWAMSVVGNLVLAQYREDQVLYSSRDDIVFSLVDTGKNIIIVNAYRDVLLELMRLEADDT